MHITISPNNIKKYRLCPHFDVTEVTWEGFLLEAQVLANLPNMITLAYMFNDLKTLEILSNCPQLEELHVRSSGLGTLRGIENCPKLRKLLCGDNTIASLQELRDCSELEALECERNGLASLEGLDGCLKLQVLECEGNRLASLKGLEGCGRLRRLDCDRNVLTSLEGIRSCASLQQLYFSYNHVETLEGIEGLRNLRTLMCSYNDLTSLDGIKGCTQLQNLIFRSNGIKSLEPITCLMNLRAVGSSNNPLDIQSTRVQRRLARIFGGSTRASASIYNNSQNVHDVHVQKTVCESVKNLLTDPEPKFTIDSVLVNLGTCVAKLVRSFCSDQSVHSVFMLTYSELLSYVWARIDRSEYRAELIKILSEQITDSEGKCFTGRFNRTLSVLVGFYPDIAITISDNSRIGAIIIAARATLEAYDPSVHRVLAHQLLTDAGYDAETIDPWLNEIADTA